MDWIHLTQDKDKWRAPVNRAMNIPSSINFSTSRVTMNFSRSMLVTEIVHI